jgi:hypothetical protein
VAVYTSGEIHSFYTKAKVDDGLAVISLKAEYNTCVLQLAGVLAGEKIPPERNTFITNARFATLGLLDRMGFVRQIGTIIEILDTPSSNSRTQ